MATRGTPLKDKGELSPRMAAQRDQELGELEREAHEEARPEPRHGGQLGLQGAELIERILELPRDGQLGLLRTVAPRIIAHLDDDARRGFLRDLDEEIERAERGQHVYDARPGH